jgi:prophage antirepressor-like protein
MDIISIENCNQTQLLVEQFKHFNIEVHGTYDEPLFKAKDIGDLLEMRNIREVIKNFNEKQRCDVSLTDAIGRQQNTTFLTEKGLYKVLMRSRKPIAEEFQDWVCELIKHIRLNSNNQLQNKIKELEFYKEPSYQELPLEEIVYCFSTDIDNVYKIGKTTNKSTTRKTNSQTPCVKDIKILHEIKTTDCDLLEKLVHYSLHRYRLGKREHFSCLLQHIKFVMDKCAKFVNTIGCVRQNITEQEFTDKLQTQIVSDKIIQKTVKKIIYKTKYHTQDLSDIRNLSDFDIDELLSKPLIEELN